MARMPNLSKGKWLHRLASVLRVLEVLCFLWCGGRPAYAEEESMESKLKVAFLLNFAKFTTWPSGAFSGPAAPFYFWVRGNDPLGTALNGLEKKQVHGRAIQVQRFSNISKEMGRCHLVYLGPSEDNQLGKYLQVMAGKPILMVSETPGFARAGGMIELRREEDRLGFVVNNKAAQVSGLQLNSSFLHLAQEVL